MTIKFQLLKMTTQVLVLITVILLLCPLLAPASKQGEDGSSAWETSQSFKAVAKKALLLIKDNQYSKYVVLPLK